MWLAHPSEGYARSPGVLSQEHREDGCTYKDLLLASLFVLGLQVIEVLLRRLLGGRPLRSSPNDVELLERAVDCVLNSLHGVLAG